jgi:alpha-D-xyloside xylohydrolase
VSEVPAADGSVAFTLKASRQGDIVTFTGAGDAQNWSVCLRNVQKVRREGRFARGQRVGRGGESRGDEVVVQL